MLSFSQLEDSWTGSSQQGIAPCVSLRASLCCLARSDRPRWLASTGRHSRKDVYSIYTSLFARFLGDRDAHPSLIHSIIRPILGFSAAQLRLAGCDRLYTPKSARAEPQQRNTGFATSDCTVDDYDNNPGEILFPAVE